MILNEVTKLVNLPECPNYFFRLPEVLKTSTSFRMILNGVKTLLDIPECPKYFLRLPTSFEYFYKLQNDFKCSYKACRPS